MAGERPEGYSLPIKISVRQNWTPEQFRQALIQPAWRIEAMDRAVALVARAAKLNLTGRFLKVRTGRLRSSLTFASSLRGNTVLGTVGTNVFYGAIHEFGTGPFDIFPRTAKALRWKSGGKWFFAKHVRHPGVRAKYWLRTAGEESLPKITEGFNILLQRQLKKAFPNG